MLNVTTRPRRPRGFFARAGLCLTLCGLGLVCGVVTRADVSTCPTGTRAAAINDQETLRVGTLNVAHGRGTGLNQILLGKRQIQRNLDALAELLGQQQLDLLALQELDIDSLWTGRFDQAEWLLDKTTFNCAVLGMHAQTWLYRFGTGVLSKFQLHDTLSIRFEPSPPSTTKGLVAAKVLWFHRGESRPVLVISVHLDFSRKSVRERQLAEIVEAVTNSPLPTIVMGDFNEQWQTEDSIVRQLAERADLHTYQPYSKELPTYKAKRLDWILLSADLEFANYQTAADAVSDHRLVVAEIRWRATP